MKIPYRGLEITLDIEQIAQALSFELTGELNDHVYATVKCLADGEDCSALLAEQLSENSSICVSDENKVIFYGYLLHAHAQVEKGKWVVELEYVSATYELDIRKRQRVFYRQDDLYADVVGRIGSLYPDIQIKDEIAGARKTPGVLLQYEETDWAFLKRLASHFASCLTPDAADSSGRFYFGLPRIDNDVALRKIDYAVVQDTDRYYHHSDIMKQEHTGWRIVTDKMLQLGEALTLNGTASVVSAVHMYEENGSLRREYTLRRKNGIYTEKGINYEILGLSLPATVTDRRKNEVQVTFDINAPYESEQPSNYFVYGIESSSFYCMPEIGSRVHIYFPGRNEAEAIAVHALNVGDGADRKPSEKKFSAPSGAAMELTPSQYKFASDTAGASILTLGVDGNIVLTGTKILLDAGKSISIGEGGEQPTPEIVFAAKTEQSVKAAGGAGSLTLESDAILDAAKVTLKAESGDRSSEAAAVRAELEAGDEKLLADYNGRQEDTTQNGGNTGSSDQKDKTGAFEPEVEWQFANFDLYNPEVPFVTFQDRTLAKPKYYNRTPGWTDEQEDQAIDDAQPDFAKNVGVSWTAEATYEKGEVPEDYKHVSGEMTVGNAYATAGAYAGVVDVKDGKCVFKPGVGASVGVGAVLMDSEVEFSVLPNDQEYFNITGGVGVTALKAAAEAEIGIGYNEEGKFAVGGSAEAGVYLIEGEAEAGVTLLGVDASVKASGKVGFGAEAEFGYKDGKIKAKVGLVALIGGSVEFEIDIGDCVDMVSGWFE